MFLPHLSGDWVFLGPFAIPFLGLHYNIIIDSGALSQSEAQPWGSPDGGGQHCFRLNYVPQNLCI